MARIRFARVCTNGSLNQRVLFGRVLIRVNIEAATEGLAGSASFPKQRPRLLLPLGFKSLSLSFYFISQKYCDNSKNHKNAPAEPSFYCILFYRQIIRGVTIFEEV